MAFTLSPEREQEVDQILTRYPERRAALLPVLWLCQRQNGWISPEVVDYVAGRLGLSTAGGEGCRHLLYDVLRRAGRREHRLGLPNALVRPSRRKGDPRASRAQAWMRPRAHELRREVHLAQGRVPRRMWAGADGADQRLLLRRPRRRRDSTRSSTRTSTRVQRPPRRSSRPSRPSVSPAAQQRPARLALKLGAASADEGGRAFRVAAAPG